MRFGDIETRAAESITRWQYRTTLPYGQTGLIYDTEEYLLDNLTEYSSGSFNLATLTATQALVVKTTYANYLTKSETITPANDYQVGASFYASMRLKPLDYVQSQTSNKKDLKAITRLFFNLVDS